MHKTVNQKADGWSISRYKFFILVWGGSFLWYFIPGLLMPALSYFSIVTWFAPKNVVVSNLVCTPSHHSYLYVADLISLELPLVSACFP